MKAKLIPLYFPSRDKQFKAQIDFLSGVLFEYAEILPELPLGADIPEDADAVLFPQILGDAYDMSEELEAIRKKGYPILVITSQFGTFSMWDWEINNFMKSKGINLIMPYNLEQSKTLCRALSVKREMKQTKFRVYQDNPGEGMQPEIFKCFYWWGDECTDTIKSRFGVEIEKKSWKELAQSAKDIPDKDAEEEWKKWDFPIEGLSNKALLSAVKLFLAIERDMDDDLVGGMGINCLNESSCSDTTPCLAWNMLYEKYGMIWACEGDTLTLTTKYILHKSLGSPIMMTNIYPFLMGDAATKHEKIPGFPEFVKDPDDHVLLAHCGYFGLVPRSFCSSWACKPPVLGIVDDNAHMFDARYPEGPLTLAKLDSTMTKIMVSEGELEGYVQYDKTSDCRNGGILKVNDGHEFMKKVYSHHLLFMTGKQRKEIELIGAVFDLELDIL
ncbi:MAG: hypothetical protein JEZ04_13955 [Spirochaetales bacterium]|nr:hypothetical protein [Spirochaetales bacterium]